MSLRLIVVLGVVGTCVSASSLLAANLSPEDRQAVDALKHGKYDEAIGIYTKLIEHYPKSGAAYYDRGFCYLHKEAYDRAIADLTKAVQLAPATPKYQSTLALANAAAYYDKGKYNEALADANEALRLSPNFAPAYNERGIIYSQKADPDKAIADFTKAIAFLNNTTLGPHDVAGPYYNRGIAYSQAAKYEKAIVDLNKAISLYPRDPYYYRTRATAYFHTRNHKGEIADLDRALQLNPASASNYNSVAWFLATCPQGDLRDGKRAVQHATKACEMTNWKHGDYVDTLAAAYAEAGEFEQAVRREQEALQLPDMQSKQDEAKARVILYQSRTPFREERRDPPKPAPIISRELR